MYLFIHYEHMLITMFSCLIRYGTNIVIMYDLGMCILLFICLLVLFDPVCIDLYINISDNNITFIH